jgi:hypothetical protein
MSSINNDINLSLENPTPVMALINKRAASSLVKVHRGHGDQLGYSSLLNSWGLKDQSDEK